MATNHRWKTSNISRHAIVLCRDHSSWIPACFHILLWTKSILFYLFPILHPPITNFFVATKIFPPISLGSPVAFLHTNELGQLLALTSNCMLYIWDINKQTCLLSENIYSVLSTGGTISNSPFLFRLRSILMTRASLF